jgi:hypothetical protein
MAKLHSAIQFTGALGNLSAYSMRGSDRIVLRTKGGPSRQRIKTSPSYEQARRNGAEFGGRSVASKWIMRMAWPLKPLADHNIAGPLNALLKPIQILDTENEWGNRHVQLSKNPSLLEGFSFNRKTGFDSVVRASLRVSVARTSLSAEINIPPLLPRINFFAPQGHSSYSIEAVMGIVPDVFCNDGEYGPSGGDYSKFTFTSSFTPWHALHDTPAPSVLKLQIADTPPDDFYSLMLSIGIRYGAIGNNSVIKQIPHAGSAKILAVV